MPSEGKENSSRRKKADRKEQRSQTSHNSTLALSKPTDPETRQHSEESGAFREMFALKDTHNKSLLKSQRQLSKPVEPVETDVTKIVTVDSQVINYGKFICGKILGSTLLVSNTSSQEQIVQILIDQKE
jgi:hypothetical protein